jgi:hypothetical protein
LCCSGIEKIGAYWGLEKVDEEVELMLGIIVSLWKMIRAVNEKWCCSTQPIALRP